jgi:hypothetical protein
MVNDGQFSTTVGGYYSITAAAINVYTGCFVNEKYFSPLSFNLHWFRQAFENYSSSGQDFNLPNHNVHQSVGWWHLHHDKYCYLTLCFIVTIKFGDDSMQVVPQISFAGLPESHGSMDLLWL